MKYYYPVFILLFFLSSCSGNKALSGRIEPAYNYITENSNQIKWYNYNFDTSTYISTFKKDSTNTQYIKFILYTSYGITDIYQNHKLYIELDNEEFIELQNATNARAGINGRTYIIQVYYAINTEQISQIVNRKILSLQFETSLGFLAVESNPNIYDVRINELLKAIQ